MGRQRLTLELDALFRFWQSIRKTDTCWLWEGTVRKREGINKDILYGSFQISGKNYLAHRVSYQFHVENTDLCILHSCDVSLCVNPEHLFAGTRKENNIDCHSKRRNKTNTKYTDLEIARCRDYLAQGMTLKGAAEALGLPVGFVETVKYKKCRRYKS